MSPPTKGRDGPQQYPSATVETAAKPAAQGDNTYIATLLYGSLATLDEADIERT